MMTGTFWHRYPLQPLLVYELPNPPPSLVLTSKGSPSGTLPPKSERVQNYRVVAGSKYAKEADRLAALAGRDLSSHS